MSFFSFRCSECGAVIRATSQSMTQWWRFVAVVCLVGGFAMTVNDFWGLAAVIAAFFAVRWWAERKMRYETVPEPTQPGRPPQSR